MADYPVSIEKVRKALVELRDSLGESYICTGFDMALARLEGFPPMDTASSVFPLARKSTSLEREA